ncbi:MAG: sporulation protein YabP, partial [Defluviitaleaceae bacterium]|nr:sporulation protein YabP [Defluviitaleaceae bacterium]
MSEQKRSQHKLTVDQRESVAITGVLDVISFDEEQVVCETDMGVLILRGANLHVASLNLEIGSLAIFGEIVSINYESAGVNPGQRGKKSSMFGKIF